MISSTMSMFALVLFVMVSTIHALSLPQAISSNMVLQRAPQSATIWGTASVNSIITATLDSLPAVKAITNAAGEWTIDLPPQNASIGRVIKLDDSNGPSVTLSNVAFGDVYVCSGQSNMEFSVGDSFDGKAAVADSINYPNLRLFSIEKKASLTPLNDTINRWQDGQKWTVSNPTYVGGPSFSYFSATCYYFGRELYKAVNTGNNVVPIGLIDTCWGGTRIEAWTTPAGLAQCGTAASNEEFYAQYPELQDQFHPQSILNTGRASLRTFSRLSAKHVINADPDPQTVSVLYNGMIYPIIKMKIRGATWYQGEANAGDPNGYACRFPAMIQDWRQQFNNYDMWFGFVLLAAYGSGGNGWPLIRQAQLAALQLPNVHVSSAQDLGDEASPQGNIHPRNKTLVGARLALGAQSTIYKQNVVSTGPSPSDILWPIDTSSTQSVILRFATSNPANVGLSLKDTSGCTFCCAAVNGSAFTIGTSDNRIVRASTIVDALSGTVIVTANNLPANVRVTSVRHGWETYQQCALYNQANIPHLPVNVARP